jgi:hypothetical protein
MLVIKRNSAFNKRLQAANKAYESAHFSMHYDFRRKYAETLRKHNIPNVGGVEKHFTLPLEFHEDMKEAQRTLIAGLELAKEARRVSIGRGPRQKIVKTFAGGR